MELSTCEITGETVYNVGTLREFLDVYKSVSDPRLVGELANIKQSIDAIYDSETLLESIDAFNAAFAIIEQAQSNLCNAGFTYIEIHGVCVSLTDDQQKQIQYQALEHQRTLLDAGYARLLATETQINALLSNINKVCAGWN